jgi:Ser/Thr protein kinase RdoA (MazF antagonist)
VTGPWTDSDRTRAETAQVRRLLGLGDSDQVAFDDTGWDSRVYLVNGGEQVVKFARSAQTVRQYRHEIEVLEALEHAGDDLGVITPSVRWRDPALRSFAYDGIVGCTLSSVVDGSTTEERRRIGQRLGEFTRALHQLDLPGLPRRTVRSELRSYQAKMELSRTVLERHLSRTELAALDRFALVELPGELQRLGAELRVGHGDLGPWNVIVAPGAVGVIDFGDAAYHDVSKDLSGFGDQVLAEAAWDAYGAGEATRAKARLRGRALPLLDLPFHLGKGDDEEVDRCIEALRAGALTA